MAEDIPAWYFIPLDHNVSDSAAISVRETFDSQIFSCLQRLAIDGRDRREEARLWLLSDLCQLIPPVEVKVAKLSSLLALSTTNGSTPFTLEFLELLCLQRPAAVGTFLKTNDQLYRKFFEQDHNRIMKWFGHIQYDGTLDLGARSLRDYAFAERERVWHLLQWTSRHSVAPVVAAARPSELALLDVKASIRNFFRVHEFWSSEEFQAGVASGSIFALDFQFFAKALLQILQSGSAPLKQIVDEFVADVSLSMLNRALAKLTEAELVLFCRELLPAQADCSVEYITQSCVFGPRALCRNGPLDSVLLINAVVNRTPELVRCLRDDAKMSAVHSMWKTLLGQFPPTADAAAHWTVRRALQALAQSEDTEWSDKHVARVVRFVFSEAAVFLYRARQACDTQAALQQLVDASAIGATVEMAAGFAPVDAFADVDPMAAELKKRKRKAKRAKRAREATDSESAEEDDKQHIVGDDDEDGSERDDEQQESYFAGWRVDSGFLLGLSDMTKYLFVRLRTNLLREIWR